MRQGPVGGVWTRAGPRGREGVLRENRFFPALTLRLVRRSVRRAWLRKKAPAFSCKNVPDSYQPGVRISCGRKGSPTLWESPCTELIQPVGSGRSAPELDGGWRCAAQAPATSEKGGRLGTRIVPSILPLRSRPRAQHHRRLKFGCRKPYRTLPDLYISYKYSSIALINTS